MYLDLLNVAHDAIIALIAVIICSLIVWGIDSAMSKLKAADRRIAFLVAQIPVVRARSSWADIVCAQADLWFDFSDEDWSMPGHKEYFTNNDKEFAPSVTLYV